MEVPAPRARRPCSPPSRACLEGRLRTPRRPSPPGAAERDPTRRPSRSGRAGARRPGATRRSVCRACAVPLRARRRCGRGSRREVRAGREQHDVRLEHAAVAVTTPVARERSSAARSTSVSVTIVRFGRSRAGRGRRTPRSSGVRRRRSPGTGRRRPVRWRRSDRRSGSRRPARRRGRRTGSVRAEPCSTAPSGALRQPLQVWPHVLVRPAVTPLVVVGGRARDHHAGVDRRRAAEDAAAQATPVLASGAPVVPRREGTRVEDLGRPAAVLERPVVGAGLDEADAAVGAVAQPRGEHAPGSAAPDYDGVVAHGRSLR